MKRIASVQQVKALLNEAKDWGTWRWLTEKRRVRAAADAAWADLDEIDKELKPLWAKHPEFRKADKEAYQARMTAEATFDEAERRLSTDLARRGSEEAIEAFLLREKLHRKVRQAVSPAKT